MRQNRTVTVQTRQNWTVTVRTREKHTVTVRTRDSCTVAVRNTCHFCKYTRMRAIFANTYDKSANTTKNSGQTRYSLYLHLLIMLTLTHGILTVIFVKNTKANYFKYRILVKYFFITNVTIPIWRYIIRYFKNYRRSNLDQSKSIVISKRKRREVVQFTDGLYKHPVC